MSDEQPKAPQGQDPEKGRQPDFVVHSVTGHGDTAQWQKIGAAWAGKNGYVNAQITAAPLNGKLVFQPRAALERLRQQREQAAPAQSPTLNNTP